MQPHENRTDLFVITQGPIKTPERVKILSNWTYISRIISLEVEIASAFKPPLGTRQLFSE